MHLKRNVMPKIWPIKRKGTKYIVRPRYKLKYSVPVLMVLRDMMKLTTNRKEADKFLDSGKIKVNEKIVRDKKYPIMLFDVLSIEDKHYKLSIVNKKFAMNEISVKDSKEKIVKIIGKKILKNSVVQINLSDGRNMNVKEKLNTNDSAVVNLKENKIVGVIPFKKGSKVIFITGKYLGQEGIIEDIENSEVVVKLGKDKVTLNKNFIMVIK